MFTNEQKQECIDELFGGSKVAQKTYTSSSSGRFSAEVGFLEKPIIGGENFSNIGDGIYHFREFKISHSPTSYFKWGTPIYQADFIFTSGWKNVFFRHNSLETTCPHEFENLEPVKDLDDHFEEVSNSVEQFLNFLEDLIRPDEIHTCSMGFVFKNDYGVRLLRFRDMDSGFGITYSKFIDGKTKVHNCTSAGKATKMPKKLTGSTILEFREKVTDKLLDEYKRRNKK